MTDFNINLPVSNATTPKYRLFNTPAAPTSTAPAYAGDSYVGAPAGGAAGTDPALLAQTEQLMQSQNPRDRYQAIVNLTKMNPADALPRLQALAGAPGQDPNVVQLANEAMRVMSQMAGQQPQQPQPQQPQYNPQQPQGQVQQPAYQPGYQQPQFAQPAAQPMAAPQYNPGVGAPQSPEDAAFMMQTLQPDVSKGDEVSIPAIRQIAAIAQAHPQQKEAAFNILLNHVYHSRAESVTEALRALGAMNDQRLLPYLHMVQRQPGYHHTTHALTTQLIQQLSQGQQQGGQPGVANVNPQATAEYIRSVEFDLNNNADSMAAFAKIRQALGADPRAQSPIRQEVVRVLITHMATKLGPTVGEAAKLLGAMGAREMDTLRYLDAVARNPGQSWENQEAARNAIRQIMASPPTR